MSKRYLRIKIEAAIGIDTVNEYLHKGPDIITEKKKKTVSLAWIAFGKLSYSEGRNINVF